MMTAAFQGVNGVEIRHRCVCFGGASSLFQDSRNSERPIHFLAAPQSRDRGTGNHAGAAGLAQLWRVQAPDKPQHKREGTHPLDGDRQSKAEVGVGERANRNSWCVSELTPKQTLRSFITPEVISVCGIIQIRTKGWRARVKSIC